MWCSEKPKLHSNFPCGEFKHGVLCALKTYIASGIARMSKLCGHCMGTFSVHVNTHLLVFENFLRLYTPRLLLRPFLAINTILSVLPVCSLHIHMKVIANANNRSLTLAFHIIFTRAPVTFTWAQTWVYLGVATPLYIATLWTLDHSWTECFQFPERET